MAGVLLALAGLGRWLQRPVPTQPWAEALPSLELGAGHEVPLQGDALAILGVDTYRYIELDRAGIPVWLYAGYYAGQRTDAQIHSPEHCYPGSGWDVVESRPRDLADIGLRELLIDRGGRRRVVWFGYRTRWGWTAGSLGLKRDQILASLFARDRDALLVRLSTPILPGEAADDARERLRSVWGEATGPVRDWFERRGAA